MASVGYESEEKAIEAFESVIVKIEEGVIEEVEAVRELDCGECLNVCKDCLLAGMWSKTETKNCEEWIGCEEGEGEQGEEGVRVRTVIEFRGEDKSGKDEGLLIKQYWDFAGGSCQGTWEGVYRFYSDTSNCDVKVEVIEGSCEQKCEDSVGEGERAAVCERQNVPLIDEFSAASFLSRSCGAVEIQGNMWNEGPGVIPHDDDSDFDSGAAERGVSGMVALIVGILLVVLF